MSNLYELKENYKQVTDMVYEEDVDMQCVLDTLEAIEGEIEDKADNYAMIIKNLLAGAEAKRAEAKKMQEKAQSEENKAKFLKQNLCEIMKETGKTKFATDLFSFNIAKNGGKQAITVDGEVPEEYTKTIIENDIDKIRQALENGEKLPFAHLEPRGESLRIK